MCSCVKLNDIDTHRNWSVFRNPCFCFECPLNFIPPHRIVQKQKWPCCGRMFGCLYKGYKTSQVCHTVFHGFETRSSGTHI